jgi:hypothetical protein
MFGPRLPRLSPHRNNSSTESLRSRGYVTAENFTHARPCAVEPVVADDFADKRLCVSVLLFLYPFITLPLFISFPLPRSPSALLSLCPSVFLVHEINLLPPEVSPTNLIFEKSSNYLREN